MTESSFPNLPFLGREKKPRETGINYVRAPVLVGQCIDDYLQAYSDIVDIFKLSGKQAGQMSRSSLLRFLETCKSNDVMISIGNPLMDMALNGGRKIVDDYLDRVVDYGVDIIEISSIARSADDDDICRLIDVASKRGLKVINEVGIAFAHSEVQDNMIFSERLGRQIQRFLDAGSWKILLESEGITENLERDKFRWQLIDRLLSPLALSQFMVEADDQDVLSKYIEIYGPNINMMVDYSRVLKMEDARTGHGPSQSLWGKVVKY
tara:strand:+ start:98 stop:892 length:795 start_codon:yes stop_codon:yes gene_type:complete